MIKFYKPKRRDTDDAPKKLSFLKSFLLALVSLMMTTQFSYSQQLTASGIVVDEANLPVPSVTVSEKNGQNRAVTDARGQFSIHVKSAAATLNFRMIGFESKEVLLAGKLNVKVTLTAKANSLNEVVVIGYGQTERKNLAGSVGTVDMKGFSKAPVMSLDQALGGRVAGVQVTSRDGQPGSVSNVVIRGQSSITQDNNPLYVIDGFPIESPDLNSINPADIESIQILKDAASAAIYGSRGANGVILITTKRGKSGKPVVAYDFYSGFDDVINRVSSMNSYEFVKYQYEVDPVITTSTYLTNGRTIESYRNAPSIDWEDVLYRRAYKQNHNLSLRGGNEATKYSISSSYSAQDGVILNSGLNRYQGRMTLDQVVNPSLKVGANINYSSQKSYGSLVAVGSGSSLLYNMWARRPTDGSADDTDLLENGIDLPTDTRWNPLLSVKNELRDRPNTDLNINAYVQYTLIKGLEFKATGVYQKSIQETDEFNNSQTRSGSPLTTVGINGVNGSIVTRNLNYLTNENTLTYNNKFGEDHTLNVVAGYTIQSTTNKTFGAAAIQVPNENLGLSGLDEGTPLSITSSSSTYRMQSFLGRAIYNYKSKYILTASFRADGSSKFKEGGNRWGYFPSAAIAWTVSNEPFLKNVKQISDLKLRLSYGAIGNNKVSDFAYLSTLTYPITASYSFNGDVNKGIVPSVLGNPDLKWETSEELNLGVDIALFDDRISFTAEAYNKKTKNLLLLAQLPPSFGYGSAFRNIGAVQNKGLEFAINTRNIVGPKFGWSSSFNISFNRNKVLSLTDNQKEYFTAVNFDTRYSGASPYITRIGQPIGMFYGYQWLGNYQYSDFDQPTPGTYVLKPTVATNGSPAAQIKPGHIKYLDIDGNLVGNDLDRMIIGNPNPQFIGGFGNDFYYKNFDLNIFCQFSYGNQIMNANRLIFEGLIGTTGLNMFETFVNRWSPTNQNNTLFTTGGGGPRVYSTRTLEDGSYLRVKTVSLGYKLPEKFISKIGIKTFRIYASAQNILTWTKYSGLDPEVATFSSPIVQGFDFSAYPRPRTIVFGLNVTL